MDILFYIWEIVCFFILKEYVICNCIEIMYGIVGIISKRMILYKWVVLNLLKFFFNKMVLYMI